MNSIFLDPKIALLRDKVRRGLEPSNPALIKQWLLMDSCCANRRGLSLCKRCSKLSQQHLYERQFYYLLEVVKNPNLDGNWRMECLRGIDFPLQQLGLLAENSQDWAQYQNLKDALADC